MSRSSPTTTSAVNENLRPPLTTLATRLISTTRSWSSRPADETVRSRVGMGPPRVPGLKPEPALSRALRERLHPAVVLVAAAVENDLLDPGGAGALREELAGAAGLLHPGEPA